MGQSRSRASTTRLIYPQAWHGTADGATNALLLIRHGALHLLYVNGKLVDRYYDRRHVSPRSGAVGIFSDGGDITARFTDFAIYPTPAQLAAVPIPSTLPAWLT